MTPRSASGAGRLILGIDPGSTITGYGLLRYEGSRIEALDYGLLKPSRAGSGRLDARLRDLFQALEALLGRVAPDVVAVEGIFSHRNVQSALRLAHARGVVLLAAARAGVVVREHPPRLVKASVTGVGSADKQQVQRMVRVLLGLPDARIPLDASDALAVALCEAHASPLRDAIDQLARAEERSARRPAARGSIRDRAAGFPLEPR